MLTWSGSSGSSRPERVFLGRGDLDREPKATDPYKRRQMVRMPTRPARTAMYQAFSDAEQCACLAAWETLQALLTSS